ncbi:MAG: hypothetical protein ACI4SV_01840 [Duodenibacillus sp.]
MVTAERILKEAQLLPPSSQTVFAHLFVRPTELLDICMQSEKDRTDKRFNALSDGAQVRARLDAMLVARKTLASKLARYERSKARHWAEVQADLLQLRADIKNGDLRTMQESLESLPTAFRTVLGISEDMRLGHIIGTAMEAEIEPTEPLMLLGTAYNDLTAYLSEDCEPPLQPKVTLDLPKKPVLVREVFPTLAKQGTRSQKFYAVAFLFLMTVVKTRATDNPKFLASALRTEGLVEDQAAFLEKQYAQWKILQDVLCTEKNIFLAMKSLLTEGGVDEMTGELNWLFTRYSAGTGVYDNLTVLYDTVCLLLHAEPHQLDSAMLANFSENSQESAFAAGIAHVLYDVLYR